MDNNPNSYTLNWKYNLYYPNNSQKENKGEYIEIVTGQETGEDVHSGFGYIAMLEYAKRVIEKDRKNLKKIPDEIIGKEIIDTYCLKNGYGKYYLISLMLAIAADELKKLAIDLLSGSNKKNKRANRIISKVFKSNPNDFQAFFNARTREINDMFFCYQENKSDDLWEKLFDLVRKIIESCKNQKLKDFLNEHLVDDKFRGGCVGIYFFDSGKKPLISFSGYKDSDIDVETKNIVKDNEDIINFLNSICESLNAELANTNEKVTKYRIAQNNITVVKDYSLKDVMDSPDLEIGKDFSCCERKIFTKFKRMNGTLHTSFFPCEKCQLGILYYSQRCVDIKCEWDIKDKKPVKSGKKPVCQK